MNAGPSTRRQALDLLGLTAALALWGASLTGTRASTNSATGVTLDEISRAMGGVKTVFARFVQERHLSLFQEPLRSEGFLCCQKPGRIRWEITQPYRSVLVSDGSGVAQFEWIDDQWKRLDLGLADAMQQIVNQIAGIIEGRYASRKQEFEITVAPSGAGPVLTLVPQQEKVRKMMRAIEVHLAADLKGTRRVVLRENNADFTEIRFEEQVTDGVFPSATFDRAKPAPLESIQRAVSPNQR